MKEPLNKPNNFFEKLTKAINILIDKEEIEKPKRYTKEETAHLKKTMRYRHIDYIIKSVNEYIKEESKGFFSLNKEEQKFLRQYTSELSKLKKHGNFKQSLKLYTEDCTQKEISKALEYLGNRHINLIENKNNIEEFERILELQVVENLRDQFIPLLSKAKSYTFESGV